MIGCISLLLYLSISYENVSCAPTATLYGAHWNAIDEDSVRSPSITWRCATSRFKACAFLLLVSATALSPANAEEHGGGLLGAISELFKCPGDAPVDVPKRRKSARPSRSEAPVHAREPREPSPPSPEPASVDAPERREAEGPTPHRLRSTYPNVATERGCRPRHLESKHPNVPRQEGWRLPGRPSTCPSVSRECMHRTCSGRSGT